MTRRYIAGERSRFVSPIALFLFSVFLMFAVFNVVGDPFGNTGGLRTTAHVEASQGSDAVQIDGLETAPAWLNTLIRQARGNPSLLAYKLQSNAYKFSWALIPISVPFVWLLFAFRRQYRAYDHLVFVTYSIAFMSLLLVLLSLVRAAGLPDALGTMALLLVPPLHIYRQLKGAYQLRRFAALWRTIALLLFAAIAILLFFMLVFAIGAH